MAADMIDQIASLMKKSKNTVVVTGAGISTEAGIPDFRGEKGIYRQIGEDRVMRIINIDFFKAHPDQFYSFYRQYFNFPAVEPSKAHYVLARLEEQGIIKGVVTQNIDNLHQQAGSRNVIPVHGNAEEFICMSRNCGKIYDLEYVQNSREAVPYCSDCGGIIKPNVVLFGENINNYMGARQLILDARLLIVIGSSLTVFPLAGFVSEFSTFTQDLVIINKGPTQMDHAARCKINVNDRTTGDILEEIYRKLQ
jgi:NAD-dependent deacetylase